MAFEIMTPLSQRAMSLLEILFAKNSNLQVPVGVADEVIEIRNWIASHSNQASS